MGEKIMVDFPGFITRDSTTRHLLVGDDTHVLLSLTIVSELYRRLFTHLGFEETARIIYESTKQGTFEVQKNLIKAYHVSLKNEQELSARIARASSSVKTYGQGTGTTVKSNEVFVYRVKNSAIAEALQSDKWDRPVCFFLAGFFSGLANAWGELLDPPARFDCVETKCIAAGAPHCEFKLTRHKD